MISYPNQGGFPIPFFVKAFILIVLLLLAAQAKNYKSSNGKTKPKGDPQ
jgi:hypothetical protein